MRHGLFIFWLFLWGLAPISATAAPDQLPFATPVVVSELPAAALIETTKGAFEIKFYGEEAPITVRNFEHLGKKRFYENTPFRRYIEDFVIQAGDPTGTGESGPGYSLPAEFSSLKHRKGTIGMARLASEVNPERRSNGSQFYICLGRARHLDGLYTVFAEVINGFDVLEKLRPEDKILQVKFPRK